MGLFDKVSDLAKENKDKIEDAIEQVGDLVDEKTGSQYADKVDQVQDAANEQLDKLTGDQA